MKVVITSATTFEITNHTRHLINTLAFEKHFEVSFYTTGVGLLSSAVNLCRILNKEAAALVIQAGIAGCFNPSIPLTTTGVIKQEYLGDTGVDESSKWNDMFDLGLVKENETPFLQKALVNHYLPRINKLSLPEYTGITVNEITTRNERIEQLKHKYAADAESMEGAALHYACLTYQVPFLQLRSFSNYAGERNKNFWKIQEAIQQLGATLVEYVTLLEPFN